MTSCQHDLKHDYYWRLDSNEAGWKCLFCGHRPGEPEGFSPRLDRELIERKVTGILMEMHESGLLYISNGAHGDSTVAAVARRCRGSGFFDQYTIVFYILKALRPGHAEYWRPISDGVLSGRDPRSRCHCGKLANAWRGGVASCADHLEPL